MKRCKVAAELELLDNLIGCENAFEEIRTAVHDSVTYCLDLAHALDTTDLGIGESVNDNSDSNRVVGHFDFLDGLGTVSLLVFDLAVKSDTLAVTLCHNTSGVGVKKLILE